MKPRWDRKACGCVKADLPRSGKITIRCAHHLGKPSKKRLLCHWEDGIVVRSP